MTKLQLGWARNCKTHFAGKDETVTHSNGQVWEKHAPIFFSPAHVGSQFPSHTPSVLPLRPSPPSFPFVLPLRPSSSSFPSVLCLSHIFPFQQDISLPLKEKIMGITKVHARQIYDSRGNPTVEVDLFTEHGKTRAFLSCHFPSGLLRCL